MDGVLGVENQQMSNENGKKLGGCTGKGFVPGRSGNPKGRPKHKTLMEEIREQLSVDGASPSIADIAKTYILSMQAGSFQHLKEYIDREQGKVPDRVANADGTNLAIDMEQLTTDELTFLRAIRLRTASAINGN